MKKNLYFTLTIFIIFMTGCNQKQNQFTIIKEDTKTGVVNQSGYVVVKPIYKQISRFDGYDNFITHPHFLNLHWIHNQSDYAYAIVQDINNKFGVINQKGELLLKPIYDSLTYFFDGFMRIQVGQYYGLVDEDFNIVLKPIYTEINEFTDDIAIIKENGKYGCIDKDMEVKVKPTYDKIYFQQEQFLRTKLDNKWGYLDHQCNILSKPIFDYAYDFSNNIAKVIIHKKVGYLNSEGKLLVKPIFKDDSLSF